MSSKRDRRINMKKKTGKVNQIATGFAAVLLGLIVAGTGTKVFANNNSDTYEYFSFSGDNTVHSDFRRKDDTSSWCKCFNASSDESEFYVTVYGTSEHNNTSGSYCGRRAYVFGKNKEWYMWNTVYETYGDDAYTAAYLAASPKGFVQDDFECWWSPDNGSGIYGDEER